MKSTWESRDLPVLDAAVAFADEHGPVPGPYVRDLAQITGLPSDDVLRAVLALESRYLELSKTFGPGDNWRVSRIYPEAREVVGQWPSPEVLGQRLIDALKDAAEREPDEERRSKLRRAAEVIGGLGRDLLTGVMSGVITGG